MLAGSVGPRDAPSGARTRARAGERFGEHATMRHVILAILAAALGLAAGCGGEESTDGTADLTVGFLLETYDVNRWARDEALFTERAEALGAGVVSKVADGDQDRQNKQADTLLALGARVLVVVPKNMETAARIVTSAHAKDVPVVAYDRLIRNAAVDVYVTFDSEQVGYLQAKAVLERVPEGNYILMGGAATDNNARLLRAGQLRAIREHEAATGKTIRVLDDRFLDNWDRDEARQRIGRLLETASGEGTPVHAIVASNDSTAGGAVAALKSEGLDGRVAVSGQDAELDACQRVVEGTQTVTVYKPVRRLAAVAAELAVRLARGEKAEDAVRAMGHEVQYLDNGAREIPSVFLEPVAVTAENMAEVVVADGWHSREDVYANVPRDRWPAEK
jgi:D-xylose transport system substrate-binding protein